MRKVFYYILIVAGIGSVFAACTKSNNSAGNTMSATIGTSSFTANNVSARVDSSTYSRTLTITGSNNTQAITLTVLKYLYSPGNYYVTDSAPTAVCTYNSGVSTFQATTGKVFLNSVSASGDMSGTFTFTTSNSTAITNGSFTIHGK